MPVRAPQFWNEIDRALSRFLTPAIKFIILINVAVTFLLAVLTIAPAVQAGILLGLAQIPYYAVLRGQIWRFVTYGFVHLEFMHLLFNMLGLWFFGPPLETRWGTRRFWRFYLTVIAGAAVLHAIFTLALKLDSPMLPVIGASGGVFGVMLAYAAYYPNQPILLFGIYPIQAKYVVGGMIFLTFLNVASPSLSMGSHISYLTHLTGLLIAYGWMAAYHRDWDIRKWRWMH